MKFADYEGIFLKKCNAKNLSLGTIKNYQYCLKTFFDFCQQRNYTSIEQINNFIIMDFISDLNKHYSSITVRDKYVIVKAFFTFLTEIGYLDNNPVPSIEKPKHEKNIIYAFTKEEVKDIISMFDTGEFIGLRNYTIMNFLFSTGVRKSELLNILLTDIDWGSNLVKINGKGSKQRYVPLSAKLQRIVLKYIKARKNYIIEHKHTNLPILFINKDCRPLKASGVNTIFKNIRDNKPHWSTRVSAHTFRHTFAKFFLLNGGDLFTLQKILGHGDISFTRLYVDLNTSKMSVQNEKFNPLDNTKWEYY